MKFRSVGDPYGIYTIALAALTSSVLYGLNYLTDNYYISVVILSVIVQSFFIPNLVSVIGYTLFISMFADYYFIPPIGSVFSSVEGWENFSINILVALAISFSVRALHKARRQADNNLRTINQAMAMIQHDLRNPVSAMKIGIDRIMQRPESPKNMLIYESVIQSFEKFDTMTRAMLDARASMDENGKFRLTKTSCDLASEIERLCTNLVGSGNVSFVKGQAVDGVWDLGLIGRVLDNLVSNAIKYGDPNGEIKVKVIKTNDLAEIRVHNYGAPIPESAKIFDTFTQVEQSNAGWGVGLAFVALAARSHGGSVDYTSSKEGTTFMFRAASLPEIKRKKGLIGLVKSKLTQMEPNHSRIK